MVSVTCRVTTGVTETAGGGGAPWAAATPQEAATLSAQTAAFQATELRPGIEVLLTAGSTPTILLFSQMVALALCRDLGFARNMGTLRHPPGRKICSRRGPRKT